MHGLVEMLSSRILNAQWLQKKDKKRNMFDGNVSYKFHSEKFWLAKMLSAWNSCPMKHTWCNPTHIYYLWILLDLLAFTIDNWSDKSHHFLGCEMSRIGCQRLALISTVLILQLCGFNWKFGAYKSFMWKDVWAFPIFVSIHVTFE